MSSALHVTTTAPLAPGYSPYNSRSHSSSGFIRRTSGSSWVPIAYYQKHSQIQVESLRCAPKKGFVCRASSSGQRRNPDYSIQKKQGFSRSRSSPNGTRDNFENLEEPEPVSSKYGAPHSIPDSAKYNATATPGPREKEIVELFRNVQAQLRERAAIKEEKKIESLRGKGKENETVGSLLKLLRKHSVEQGKRSHVNVGSADSIDHHLPPDGRINGDKSTNSFKLASPAKEEYKPPNAASSRRPASKFQKKSPVPQARPQSVYTRQDAIESLPVIKNEKILKTHSDDPDLESEQELDPEPEPKPVTESLLSSMTIIHEAESSDEENDESEIEEDSEPYKDEEEVEETDLSSLKLTELRALAKVRGLKGFSKLKKSELVKLLS